MQIAKTKLVSTAYKPGQYTPQPLREVAVVGRSNAGKSSLVNTICNNKKLARVSSAPGKTRSINFYNIDSALMLVDLPGYGFAKVSQQEKDRWGRLMEDYFAAQRIDLGVLIVDYRHPPTNNDITMANWFLDSGCPFVVVANKMDKLKKSELKPNLEVIRRDLGLPDNCPVIPFSAEKGDGREELVRRILSAVKE